VILKEMKEAKATRTAAPTTQAPVTDTSTAEAPTEAPTYRIGPDSGRILYVGVMSAPGYRKRRDVVRSTYLNALRKNNSDGRILAEFIIGHEPFTSKAQGTVGTPEQLQLEEEIAKEAEVFGDIRRIPVPDAYENLPDKVIQLLDKGLQKHYNFYMKIDDDQVLNVNAAERLLSQHSSTELLYAGISIFSSLTSKLQLGPLGQVDFVSYFSGRCYMLSWALAHQIVEVHGGHTAGFLRYGQSSEDVDMGRWVQWESTLGHNVTVENVPGLTMPQGP